MSIVYKVFNKPQVPSGFFISLNEKKRRNQNMEEKWEQNLTLRGDLVLIL